MMKLRIGWGYVFAFACLLLVQIELHEQSHAIATRLLCGGWADRVFDNIFPYQGCSNGRLAVVDIAGPLFSFMWMWAGVWLLRSADPRQLSLGFSLIFSAFPIGRVLPQIIILLAPGSTSDENAFLRHLSDFTMSRMASGSLALLADLLLTGIPLLLLWRRMAPQRRLRLMASFYFLPLLFVIGWLIILMNGLLAQQPFLQWGPKGWPALIIAHTALAAAGLALGWKHLKGAVVQPGSGD